MIIHHILEGLLRGIGGGTGKFLRYHYYAMRLGSCGKRVVIDTGVHFINPRFVRIGEGAWIDKNVILIAGKVRVSRERVLNGAVDPKVEEGVISIGKYSHIGIGTILQGHGGVFLGDYCTTAPGCKVYSYSNDVGLCRTGTILDASYVKHPVVVGNNTWLGINTTIIGHTIGENCFVKPHVLVVSDIPSNTIFAGTEHPQLLRFNTP